MPERFLIERPPLEPVDDVFAYLRRLVGAVEPAIVFSSLASLCVPAFSDFCSVEIVEGGRVRYRIAAPRAGRDRAINSSSIGGDPQVAELFQIRTAFESALDGWTSYTGVIVHRWHDHTPTDEEEDRAVRLVGHAMRVIDDERRADPMRPAMAAATSTFRRAREHH